MIEGKKTEPKELWGTTKGANTHVLRVVGEDREKGQRMFREIMTENFPHFKK